MQAMSGTGPLRIEPPAVVDDLQDYSFAFDSQIDLDDGSPGMARHVVDGLLEHEKQLAAYIRFQFAASICVGRVEPGFDFTGAQYIRGEAAHAQDQVIQRIALGIDGDRKSTRLNSSHLV